MGISILSGIMSSLEAPSASTPGEELPARLPSKFIACVRRPVSAKRIQTELAAYSSSLTTLVNDNIPGLQQADVVLLGCKPYMLRDVLTAPGVKDALAGKLLMSILAGVTQEQISETLYGATPPPDPCQIVRVMPSTASFVRESMTVIATSTPPLPSASLALVVWIFSRIGKIVQLPAGNMDAGTALCGSGPAFMFLVLESLADGGVAMGLPRAEAQIMAAQTMRGAAALVQNGEHPAVLRDKVCTPGGCTIGGLLVLEEGRVRGSMSRAVREATVVASQLGKGVQNVNGTRF
ncbi:pyrroline-5-carboxylate reductase [Eremomyces bilateralis CBS 781.70]|uniref:Pyrroline-5-carboxylate reductase n=1 Tax=Eremomyces bilateralis CBS 781.70 TaxID=1392243 RepID=A0A6G1G3F1_9PEZI|nr:pyrroline-5-carboxylate reductase [Eremomyces bilateralis CBS 781.70]KAF1812637.1 pyrroline-5-carboxylate reductase [Eremomyces bilateralis CBS 781.70]